MKAVTIALLSTALLFGCSLGKTYREIDPERAQEEERSANGYYALQDIPDGKAVIVLRSEKMPYRVSFSSGPAGVVPCINPKLTPLGEARYDGSGTVYPWIAKLSGAMQRRGEPFLSTEVEPGQPIQVRGLGLWSNDMSVGNCGPLDAIFTPQSDRAYLVRFVWDGSQCRQVVLDATDPDHPVPVEASYSSCSKR
jgi:hypothetical protein